MFKFEVDEDIVLKMIDASDNEDIFRLMDANREHLRKWLPWVDSTKSVEDTNAFIQMTKQQWASNNGFQASIWYKGNLAGVIGFHGLNWTNKFTSIGYWLGEEYKGHGIMTKSCKAFIDYAFEEMHLNRVEIQCALENTGSRAIPERLGFANEGVIRQVEWLYDHFVDHVVYGVLADEWMK